MSVQVERIGDCVLYCGDAYTLRSELHADAIVSDPPYGINLRGSFNASTRRYPNGQRRVPAVQYIPHIIGDDTPFDPEPWLHFSEVLLWGAHHYACRLPEGGSWLVWDKRGPAIPSRTQADCEMAWLNRPMPARVFRHVWDGMVRDSERGEQRQHPTQKPIALLEWCLSFIKATTISDPFMGVGTTAIACIRAGRRFVGCEIDPGYFAIACQRITDAYKQLDLFVSPAPAPKQEVLL